MEKKDPSIGIDEIVGLEAEAWSEEIAGGCFEAEIEDSLAIS